MPSVNDWAAKAARHILHDSVLHRWHRMADRRPPKADADAQAEERVAAIIATFAEPLMQMLRESKREHRHSPDGDVRDGTCCPQCCCESWPDDPEGGFEPTPNSDAPCDCGADAWNARVDATLAGEGR